MGRATAFFAVKSNSKEASADRWSFFFPLAFAIFSAISELALFLREVYWPGRSRVATSASRISMARENDDEMENVSHSKLLDWESAFSTRDGSAASAPWHMKHSSPRSEMLAASSEKKRLAHFAHNADFSTTKMAKRRVY